MGLGRQRPDRRQVADDCARVDARECAALDVQPRERGAGPNRADIGLACQFGDPAVRHRRNPDITRAPDVALARLGHAAVIDDNDACGSIAPTRTR